MLVLRPDAPDERASAVIDRTTRRLAYPISRYREGSYHIIVFESPAEAIAELERSLQITEDVLRYLVTRAIRPVRTRRDAGSAADTEEVDAELPSVEDEEEEDTGERIDESESEAAPAAID
jgi:small subunit ribosomal protein S6